jgi:hypothetical protein
MHSVITCTRFTKRRRKPHVARATVNRPALATAAKPMNANQLPTISHAGPIGVEYRGVRPPWISTSSTRT